MTMDLRVWISIRPTLNTIPELVDVIAEGEPHHLLDVVLEIRSRRAFPRWMRWQIGSQTQHKTLWASSTMHLHLNLYRNQLYLEFKRLCVYSTIACQIFPHRSWLRYRGHYAAKTTGHCSLPSAILVNSTWRSGSIHNVTNLGVSFQGVDYNFMPYVVGVVGSSF